MGKGCERHVLICLLCDILQFHHDSSLQCIEIMAGAKSAQSREEYLDSTS